MYGRMLHTLADAGATIGRRRATTSKTRKRAEYKRRAKEAGCLKGTAVRWRGREDAEEDFLLENKRTDLPWK